MTVDSFKWMPFSLAAWIKQEWKVPDERATAPFTPLRKPLSQTRFSLLTTGGLYLKGKQEPFDMAREEREPDWGDPSYRVIPRDTKLGEVGVAHKHYNPADIERDFNILLPIHRFTELAAAGEIGSLAPSAYSVMGYQGHPGPGWGPWNERYGPEIIAQMKSEGVEAALLTPA
jgi:D-proline reductase (dithiol) PrdB